MGLKVGDKIKVCDDLVTVIKRIDVNEPGESIYYFEDESGREYFEVKDVIEKII